MCDETWKFRENVEEIHRRISKQGSQQVPGTHTMVADKFWIILKCHKNYELHQLFAYKFLTVIQ